MRILHLAEAFGGGLFEICRMQAEGAAERGHDVAVAYGRRPETPTDVRNVVSPSVELFETPWTDRSLRAQAAASRYVRRLVADWRPDVVHLQSSFAGVIGAAALSGTAPLVYSPQGLALTMRGLHPAKLRAFAALERFVAKRVDVVVGSSAAERDHAVYRLAAPRTAVVENGIPELDAAHLPPAARPRDPLVVAVGRLRPQRQPEAVSRILRAVSDRAQVRWVGGGAPGSPELKALQQAGVEVTGWLSRDATLAQLSRATAYLHWTAWDGLPLSVLEAMARDVPVVASDIPPNREVLGPEQVFAAEAAAEKALAEILTVPERRETILSSQRLRRRYYGAERMTDSWISLYRSLL